MVINEKQHVLISLYWDNLLICLLVLFSYLCQAAKNTLSTPEKEPVEKQNEVEKFEIREQNKIKTEAKWKYKV